MGKFMQIIEFETDKFDEINKLAGEMQAATKGKSTSLRDFVCADRDNSGRYVVIVEFPSYEDAMKNSELPEVQKFAEAQAKLVKGPPKFTNLDVKRED